MVYLVCLTLIMHSVIPSNKNSPFQLSKKSSKLQIEIYGDMHAKLLSLTDNSNYFRTQENLDKAKKYIFSLSIVGLNDLIGNAQSKIVKNLASDELKKNLKIKIRMLQSKM